MACMLLGLSFVIEHNSASERNGPAELKDVETDENAFQALGRSLPRRSQIRIHSAVVESSPDPQRARPSGRNRLLDDARPQPMACLCRLAMTRSSRAWSRQCFALSKRPTPWSFKLSGDAAEGSVELGAEVVDHGNDGKRDPGCNQPIFNGRCRLFIAPKVADLREHSQERAFIPQRTVK
jgi:hypothetical protein